MGRGVNKVILIGNLGDDPDSRMTPQGSPVTNLSVATDESYKDKQTGQKVPKTEWHRVVAFNRLAEIAKDYLKKGSKVYIEGKLQTRKWQDQNGQDKYSTEIIAQELRNLDSNPNGQQQGQGGQAQQQQQYGQRPAPQQQQNHQRQAPAPQQTNSYGGTPAQQAAPMDDFDDDIPFQKVMNTTAF